MGIIRTWALAALVVAVAAGAARAAETDLAEPKPTMDEPRRVLLTMTTDDPRKLNNLLYNVVNIQKFYGMDNVQIAVVAWGAGLRGLLHHGSPVRERVESLMHYDVEFVACGNTMETMHWGPKDLIRGVHITKAGIPEVVERRLKGWVDITP
ncbi:MAG: DsrE family protein [Hyphomicrobiales bacterium]|nr:DsrE family protein [Hyphomicrobiales bacterium]